MTSKTNSKTKPRKKTTSRRRTQRKPAQGKPAVPSPSLAEVAEGFLAHLDDRGKTASTITSYRADLGIALRHFGAETGAGSITPKQVETFNGSAAVTKTRAGKAKAKPGVDKTRRVLRLALVWAAESGLIPAAPIPKTSAKS